MILFILLMTMTASIDARKPKTDPMIDPLCVASSAILPDGFGKTHFIVGLPIQDLPPYMPEAPAPVDTPKAIALEQVLFSPDDDVTHALIELIKREKKGISIAIFTFTDRSIAQALIDAYARGVSVQVVIDPTGIKDRSCKISLLQKEGIPIYIYNPYHDSTLENNALMHHKFVIFDDNGNGPLVWTGSFNFTRAARVRNQENVVIINDPKVAARYRAQFAQLKKDRCTTCTTTVAKNSRKGREHY